MRKKVAILTKQGTLCSDLQENTEMNIFALEGNRVVEYENIKLQNPEYGSFMDIVKIKKVTLLYMNNITEELKHLLTKAGCLLKLQNEFHEDEFINQFIFA